MGDNEMADFPNLSNFSNLTEAEYLEKWLGPKYLPVYLVLPLTIVYVIIFVTGIFGNVTTCLVIIRNPSMQTATNYYLFNLAISDLTLLLLGLPNDLSLFWQQYPWSLGWGLCKIRAYVSELSSYVSVLTIVAFSMERYLAICHPLHLYAISGLKRPIRFIFAAWSVSLVCGIPFAVYTTVNYIDYPPRSGHHSEDSAFCAMFQRPNFPLYELSCIVFFLIPMVVILVLYTRMGFKIRESTRNSLGRTLQGSVHGETKQVQSRKAVVRMLSAVVIMFFICWAPFHAQRLHYIHAKSDSTYFAEINEWLYTLGGCLYYFGTTVNPILYNMMSAKYRNAFRETLCCGVPGTKRVSRDPSSFRDTTVCRCDSKDGTHTVHLRGQGCLRSNSSNSYAKKDANGNGIHRTDHRQLDQNGATEALLHRKIFRVDSQTGNERTKSYKKLEESPSTASSNL